MYRTVFDISEQIPLQNLLFLVASICFVAFFVLLDQALRGMTPPPGVRIRVPSRFAARIYFAIGCAVILGQAISLGVTVSRARHALRTGDHAVATGPIEDIERGASGELDSFTVERRRFKFRHGFAQEGMSLRIAYLREGGHILRLEVER